VPSLRPSDDTGLGGCNVYRQRTPAENLATKQQLIADAQALASGADRSRDSTDLNRVLISWAQVDSAGAEHDAVLWWRLKEACAEFYSRRGSTANLNMYETYAPLGTVHSRGSTTDVGPKRRAAVGTVSSQAGRILPTKAKRRVGGGKAGELGGLANRPHPIAAQLGHVRQLGLFSPLLRNFLPPYLHRVAPSPLACYSPRTEARDARRGSQAAQ
jgi:hypothetical protein